jgi:FkbH-like protein
LEVSWGPKSEAASRILRSWNISAESVGFVDDSPMELAEVQAAFPDMVCLQFPRESDAGIFELIVHLRDLFGKPAIAAEDAIRLESIRQSDLRNADVEARGSSPEEFLAQANAELTLEFTAGAPPERALELINKTNQFNLNGRRYTEGEWLSYLRRPETFLLLVRYQDKYGPLGMIAVLAGCEEAESLDVNSWVMSCRAFSRRIEHRCLKELFDHFSREHISFDFQATPRNAPLREFFAGFLGTEPTSAFRITRAVFEEKCPPLYHTVMR